MKSLLCQNLRLTILLALAFTVAGYAAGWAVSFYMDAYAARFELSSFANDFSVLAGRKPSEEQMEALRDLEEGKVPPDANFIETARLDEIRKLQVAIALSGTGIGILVAQTTFAAYTLTRSHNQN